MPHYHPFLLAASSQALASWLFGSVTLIFLFIAFFFIRGKLPFWKERIVAFIAALCASLFAFFLTGYILLNIEYKLSSDAKIAIQGLGGGAIFAVVYIVWLSQLKPFKEKSSKKIKQDEAGRDAIIATDRASVQIDNRQGLEPETVLAELKQSLLSQGDSQERIQQLEQQLGEYKQRLAEALKRVQGLQTKGEYPQAEQAIEDLRKSGDMTKLQALLIEDRDRRRNELIQRNREIAAVAYLRGDIQTADNAVDEILKLLPDDMPALNHKGLIYKLQGRLNQAIECYQLVLELGQKQQNLSWQAAALGNLGNVYRIRGDLTNTGQMHKKSSKSTEKREVKKNWPKITAISASFTRPASTLTKPKKCIKKPL
jgi:tetratricopeptide (TPR) repeat protein